MFESKQVELKPLENSVIDIHLTNKTGYLGQERVKALVTYQIGNQMEKIESEAVDIGRHEAIVKKSNVNKLIKSLSDRLVTVIKLVENRKQSLELRKLLRAESLQANSIAHQN